MMSHTKTNGIVVMGPFRSGTSLACRMLAALGTDFGPANRMLRPDAFNPGGYLQRADVRLANSRLIRSAGSGVAWPEHPERIAACGDLSLLQGPALNWRAAAPLWGIKDPRFCATLLSWLRAGAIRPPRIRIVHVMRDNDACAGSMFSMPELARQLRPRTLVAARKTIARYADFAKWHATHLDCPVFPVRFERLIAHPSECVAGLAEFVGCLDEGRIAAAIRQVTIAPAGRRPNEGDDMHAVRIRKMREDDLPECMAILAAWNMAPRLPTEDTPDPERTGIEVANGFVAEAGGRIVGTCSYIVHSADLAETASLAVDPACKGGGVGHLLQQARLDEMRERGIKTVRTETDRPETIRWYVEHFGYRVVGTNPKKHAFSLTDVDYWTVLELDLVET